MEEYKVAVTTKLRGGQVAERLVTVRADSVEEAETLYHQALEALPTWGPNDGASNSGQSGHQTHQDGADAASRANACPQHGKAREGKGGKLYCPTKLADGSWCKWRG